MLPKGSFGLDVTFHQNGGALFAFSYGVFERLSLGVAYGGARLIGSEEPVMNPLPGVHIKLRVLEESVVLPALAVGFDTQGKDGYLKALKRYQIKSPGLYAAASKNYSFLGYLSIHGGVNYSLEREDQDKDINAFVGAEKTIGPFISFVLEYDFAFNDRDGMAIGRGRGYLNAGLKWSIGGGLTLGLNLKDLIENAGEVNVANRTITLDFVKRL
jgi:hypothetical protein